MLTLAYWYTRPCRISCISVDTVTGIIASDIAYQTRLSQCRTFSLTSTATCVYFMWPITVQLPSTTWRYWICSLKPEAAIIRIQAGKHVLTAEATLTTTNQRIEKQTRAEAYQNERVALWQIGTEQTLFRLISTAIVLFLIYQRSWSSVVIFRKMVFPVSTICDTVDWFINDMRGRLLNLFIIHCVMQFYCCNMSALSIVQEFNFFTKIGFAEIYVRIVYFQNDETSNLKKKRKRKENISVSKFFGKKFKLKYLSRANYISHKHLAPKYLQSGQGKATPHCSFQNGDNYYFQTGSFGGLYIAFW